MKPKTKKKKNSYHVGTRREGGQIKLKTGVSSVTNQNPNQNIQQIDGGGGSERLHFFSIFSAVSFSKDRQSQRDRDRLVFRRRLWGLQYLVLQTCSKFLRWRLLLRRRQKGGGAIRNRVIFFRIKDIFLLLHIRTSSHSHFFKRSPFFIINNMYNSCSICSSPISSSNMVVKTMYIDISSRGLHYFRFCFLQKLDKNLFVSYFLIFCSPGFSSSFVGIYRSTSIYIYVLYIWVGLSSIVE